jgi:mannose-6-phosphate isomerase-like protein (cupin superfamily)
MFVIKEPKGISFEKAGIKGKIFPTHELTKKTEYFLVETNKGHETVIIEHSCDFIYYILKGSGFFIVNGEKESCRAGDLVVIPSGHTFIYKGNLKMIATSTPPWNEEQEVTLKEK